MPPAARHSGIPRLLLLATALHLAPLGDCAEEAITIVFVNGLQGKVPETRWLEGGRSDGGPGVPVGHIHPQLLLNTSPGHAFRVELDGRRSAAVAHKGDGMNLVGVTEDASGELLVEFLDRQKQRRLVAAWLKSCQQGGSHGVEPACLGREARFPRSGLTIPPNVASDMLRHHDPRSKPPVLSQQITSLSDALVVVSAVPYPLELRWAYWHLMGEKLEPAGIRDSSQLIGVLPKVSEHGVSSVVTVKPGDSDRVLMVVPENQAAGTASADAFASFVYSKELNVVVVAESGRGKLTAERLDEDEVKIALNDIARSCAETAGLVRAPDVKWRGGGQWQACFENTAALSPLNVLLPAEVSSKLFTALWGSPQHWRLCSYQGDTTPVETKDISLGPSVSPGGGNVTFSGTLLRRDPPVLAVPGFASDAECDEMIGRAGTDLGMAHVGGAGRTTTSRARRTLTRNLFVDLGRPEDLFTVLSERFFGTVRAAFGYDVYPEGQEPINYLLYQPGYEYRPHCDGACGETLQKRGSRVASSLLYCSVAEDGGGTVFTPDALKLTPSKGMLLLFGYKSDPAALSQHAACPVLRGLKVTATQWYREGVSKDEPWESFQNWGNAGVANTHAKEL